MQTILMGFGVLVIVFFLIILLGLQMQISNLTRKIDELISKIRTE